MSEKSSKRPLDKKLTLEKESVRQLDSDDLDQVGGGLALEGSVSNYPGCTADTCPGP